MLTKFNVLNVPLSTNDESQTIEFVWINCIEDELRSDETNKVWNNIIELENFNETCVHVNQTNENGTYQSYLYVVPSNDGPLRVPITSNDCSKELPELHFSPCHDQQPEMNYQDFNQTVTILDTEQTSSNLTDIDHSNDEHLNQTEISNKVEIEVVYPSETTNVDSSQTTSSEGDSSSESSSEED